MANVFQWITGIIQNITKFFEDNPETIFDCGTMIVAAISAVCAFLAFKNQRERGAKAAACDLAKYYASNIIERSAFIDDVYSSNGFTEMVKKVFPIGKIKVFTRQEMVDFIKDYEVDIDSFCEKAISIPDELILKHQLRYAKSAADRVQYVQEYSLQGNIDIDGDDLQKANLLRDDFQVAVGLLLNDLEWFSMQCRYGVADEKLLYQSLHQTFLAEVQLLYFFISFHNENSEDKFYTNVIWLFELWRNRLMKYKKKNQMEKAMANWQVVKAEAKAKRQIAKAEAKAKRAGQSIHHGKSI
ncbi:MAG: DUF4760 domain-containing protein [Oscillibacter sp.]|nr:DUF4760 domain-containing protein [Oscillibacter sp.]